MKSESGSPIRDKKHDLSPIRQRTWRIAGGIAIAICAALTLYGSFGLGSDTSPAFLLLYWVLWLASLGVAIYCVLLDLRYIRAAFLVEERDLYKETLGSEEFRRAILEAQQEMQAEEAARKSRDASPPDS